MNDYDPKTYWNDKAKSAKGNHILASCGNNEYENECMHQAQLHALNTVIDQQIDIKGKTILDFGCGSGRWVEFFCNLGAKYIGVDISDEMIELSKSRYPDNSFITLKDHKIPLETDSCDFVFSIAVIHHNRPPQQEEMLGEIARILKPGGYLFLFESLGTVQWERMFPHPMSEWIKMVEQYNFDCIMHRGYSYFVLCNLVNDVARRLHIPRVYSWRPWRPRLLLKLDAKLSPSISHRLSGKYHDRGAMLFKYIG